MDPHLVNLIVFLLIGVVAGFLAGQILKGSGFGLVGNMIVGALGALVGGFLFNVLGISAPGGALVGSIVTAFVGAVVLLLSISFVRKQTA